MYSDLSVLSTQMTTIVYIISYNTCRLQYENTSANLSLYVYCGFVFNEKVDHICISVLGCDNKRCCSILRERHTRQAHHFIMVKTFTVNSLFKVQCYMYIHNSITRYITHRHILYTQSSRSYIFIDVVCISDTGLHLWQGPL